MELGAEREGPRLSVSWRVRFGPFLKKLKSERELLVDRTTRAGSQLVVDFFTSLNLSPGGSETNETGSFHFLDSLDRHPLLLSLLLSQRFSHRQDTMSFKSLEPSSTISVSPSLFYDRSRKNDSSSPLARSSSSSSSPLSSLPSPVFDLSLGTSSTPSSSR